MHSRAEVMTMFNFSSRESDTVGPVLFLSGPFGVAREWAGIMLCLGTRGASRAFDDRDAWRRALDVAPAAAHLVAHGPAAYEALRMAQECPRRVRSVTLVDPDILAALPEMKAGSQFRRGASLRRQVAALVAEGRQVEAAEAVTDWWMGKGTFSRSSLRLRSRFAASSAALVEAWRRQEEAPFDLCRLSGLRVPVHVATGRRAPAETRSVTGLLKMVVPGLSATIVKDAGAAAHLTDPHVVGPDVSNFIVLSGGGWQDRAHFAAAA
jgi:pimeloyl-ACP methyl ester carboxylesterase